MTNSRAVNSATSDDLGQLMLVVGFGLLVLGPLVPNHYPPWASFHAEAVSTIGFCFLTAVWWQRRGPRDWPREALLPLALAVIPILQAVTGKLFFWGDAWMAVLFLMLFALAILVGNGLAREHGLDRIVKLWSLCVFASAVISVGIAIEQWLRLDRLGIYAADLRPGGRPYANVGQPNLLATWLMLGIVGVHLLYQSRRVGALGLAFGSAFLAFGMAMTQSRTGWLEMLAFIGTLVMARRGPHLRLSGRGIFATASMFAACVVAWPLICDFLLLSPGRDASAQASGGLRIIHWRSLIDALLEQPWAGYGWNQVSIAQGVGALRHAATGEVIEHSHNIVLDLLLWNGLPVGAVVVGAAMWWLGRHSWRCLDPRSALLLGGITVVLVHAMLEFPLEYTYFLLPVGLMVGMVSTFRSSIGSYQAPRWVSGVLVATLTGLLVWVAADYWKIEESSREMRFQLARIGGQQPVSAAPGVILLTQQREFWRFASTPAARDMSRTELDWMHRISGRYPYAPSLYRYAVAAGLNGRPDEAASALAHLCKVHPKGKCLEAIAAWSQISSERYPELTEVQLPLSEN